jgi:hypothetical protein
MRRPKHPPGRRPGPSLCALAAALILNLASCDDDGATSGADLDAAADTATEVTDDGADDPDVTATDLPPDADTTADLAGEADVPEEPDAPGGSGTIRGRIFNNTATTEGRLTVALVESLPVEGEPALSVVFESPSTNQPYELTGVPLNTPFWLVALLDVGGDSTLEAPGPGDRFGATEDPLGVTFDGQVLENINVEVR